MVEGYLQAFANTGRLYYPLSSLMQLALFLVAAGMFAAGTPDRASRVAQWVAAPSADIARLLARLPSELLVLINGLPAREGMTFITDRVECVVCHATLVGTDSRVKSTHTLHTTRPRLLSASGQRVVAAMCQKHCPSCKAVHYLSYAQGGDVLGGKQLFYDKCVDARYFHVSPLCNR